MSRQTNVFERSGTVDSKQHTEPPWTVEALRRKGESIPRRLCVDSSSKISAYLNAAKTSSTRAPRLCRDWKAPDIFFNGFEWEWVLCVESQQQRATITKNWDWVASRRAFFRRAQWPRSPTTVSQRVHGDSEEIYQLEVEGHGLVQILREGECFAWRISEKLGLFSRTLTVPLYCRDLCNPDKAMRDLARLSPSVIRRRVRLVSDRNHGIDPFIFVGDLGLLGGGDREPPSTFDAYGYQTAAQCSTSGSMTRRALTRTGSSLIRRIFAERDYKSLEELVTAFDKEDVPEHKLGLGELIRKVICSFNDMHVRAVTNNRGEAVREYFALCKLDSAGDEHLLLLKDFFDGLRDKLYSDVLNNRHLMEAIEHTLQSVDNEVFEDDPSCLVHLVQFLLEVFDPERTSFSREMFPVQCSAMHALHQSVRILHDISSSSWDPNKFEGPYVKFKDWCQRVIDAAEHYPVKYHAKLLQQSLTLLQSSKRGTRHANNARRIANLLYGEVGVYQMVRKAILLDFDLGNAEMTVRALEQAKQNRIIHEAQWHKYLHALDVARFAAIEDPLAFEMFNNLLFTLVLEEKGSDREQCKITRFAVVEMLYSLAIHGKDGAVRKISCEILSSLVEQTDEWDWLSDPDLFQELLENLSELSFRGYEEERRKAHSAIDKLAANVQGAKCEQVLSKWLEEKNIHQGIQQISSAQEGAVVSNRLFYQVWKSVKSALSRAESEARRPTKHHGLFSPLVVHYFAGRKIEYNELVNVFELSSESVVVKTIVGPGGIGKSQLAAKVFEHLKSTSNYVDDFWIPSDSEEGLSAAFLQIAEYLELPTDTEIPKIVRHIQEELRESLCLYVFDDVSDLDMIRKYLPQTNGHVIVTTRDGGARDWEGSIVRLEPFNKLEAQDLAGRFGYGGSSDGKVLEELFDLLPRVPLALTQFFSMMKHEELSPAEWLDRVQRYDATKREVEVIEMLSAKHDGEGASGMVFVFNSSMRRISEAPNDLGAHSIDLLTKLALLDPNGVPIEMMYKWYGCEDLQSRTRTRKSVRLLERFSHVSWNREKNQIFIHAETQLLARHVLLDIGVNISDQEESGEQTKKNVKSHINSIVQSIEQYIGDWRMDRLNRELWTLLAQNTISLLRHCEKQKGVDLGFKLIKHISTAYGKMCMFRESLLYTQRAFKMCERLHGEADHADLVDCMRNYAIGLARTGRDNEALPLYKRAVEMCERLHGGADHSDLVACIKSYSVGLERTGKDIEALHLYKRALEMSGRICGGADNPDLIDCIKNCAISLARLGKDNEALPLYKRALEMCERLYGNVDHPDLVDCIRNYSAGLARAGRDNEALPFDEKALKMCERLHGVADHPDLVACIRNYALGLERSGKDNEALPLYKRALEMCTRLHGNTNHPDLVDCIKSYSIGLARTGREKEALPFRKRALEMCEQLHGDASHMDFVACIRNYAIGLTRTGRDDEALSLYKRALEMSERLHGNDDHPDLVTCIRNYAVGLKRKGRHSEALPLHKRALEMCERLHGNTDHPDLVDCIRSYAIGLSRTGREGEALPLRKRALVMCERLYGDVDHPNLVACMRNYAIGLERSESNNEALVLLKRAFEMCKRLHGDTDHPDLVACIKSYAIGLAKAERDDEALSYSKRAKEMLERLGNE